MNTKTKTLVYIAIFSALSMILMSFRIALPPFPSFYKLDFSESVIVLGGFYLGPVATVVMQILKNVLKLLTNGTNSLLVGDLANMIMGLGYCLPAVWYFCHSKEKNTKDLIVSLVIGTVALGVISCFVNYFIVIPMYANVYHMPIEKIVAMGQAVSTNITSLFSFVCLATLPFNMIKGALSSIIAALVFKSTASFFKK